MNRICFFLGLNYMLVSKINPGTSLAVQWLRLCFPMQGTQVQPLVGELRSHMPRGNKAHVLQLLNLHTTTREACLLQQRPSTAKKKKKSIQLPRLLSPLRGSNCMALRHFILEERNSSAVQTTTSIIKWINLLPGQLRTPVLNLTINTCFWLDAKYWPTVDLWSMNLLHCIWILYCWATREVPY